MAAKDTIVNLVIGAQDRASKTITRFQKALGGVQGKVAAVGASIATYFGGRAIARFFSNAVSGAAEFEAQMDKVAAVSGATTAEMEQLTAAAEKMGAETPFTATQSAEALELLARAGLSANESIGTLPTVLALATGSGLELSEAASQITSTTSAMGLSFDEAGRVADVLTKAAASANTNVQQLGNAMSYAGPVAATLGLSIEDTAALIGKFSDAGIRGERAGTALRSILAQMSDPASGASEALRDLGIATDDPIQAITELAKAGPKGQAAIREFGLEAGPALQALLNQGMEGLQALRGELQNAGGSAETAAKLMQDNLGGALKGLGSAWEAIKKKLASPLLEPIKEEVIEFTARLREFAGSDELKQFAQSLVTGFKNIASSVKQFLADFDFKKAIQDTGDFAENVSGHLTAVGNTLTVVGQSIRLFLNGFAAGVKTIGAVVSALFAGITRDAATVLDFLGADEWAAKARNVAGALSSVSKEFEAAIAEDSKDIEDSFSRIVGAMESSGTAYQGTAKAAEESGERQKAALDGVADSAEKAAAGVDKTAEAHVKAAQGSMDYAIELGKLIANGEQSTEALLANGRAALQQAESVGKANYIQALYDAALAEGTLTKQEHAAATAEVESAIRGLSGAVQADTQNQGDNKDKHKEAADTKREAAAATRELNEATEHHVTVTQEDTKAVGNFAAALANSIQKQREFFAGFGDEAAAEFDQIVEATAVAGQSVNEFLRTYEANVGRLRDAYERQADATERATDRSEELKDKLEDLEVATLRELDAAEGTADRLELIDGVDLSSVRDEIARLRDENERLNDSITDTYQNLQDEYDRMVGNQAAIEERDYDRRLQELEDQLEAARAIGDDQAATAAQNAIDLLNEIHDQRMQNIDAEERRANDQAEQEKDRVREQAEQDRQQNQSPTPASGGTGGGGSGGGTPATRPQRLEIKVTVDAMGQLTNQQAEAFARQLTPAFEKIFRRQQ